MGALHGNQTTLKRNGVLVGGLDNIGGVEITAGKLEKTTLTTTMKQYFQDLPEAADIPVSGHLEIGDANGQIAMLSDIKNRTEAEYTITLPNSMASWTFNAFLTSVKIGEFVNGKIPFSATLAPTDEPVFSISESTGLTMPFLALSGGGTLTPAAANDVYEYVYNVANGTSSITLTPTAAGQTIKVNGNTVESGQASSAISLTAGQIVDIKVEVTESGKVPVTYVIHAIEAAA
jgi:hypothetical protein